MLSKFDSAFRAVKYRQDASLHNEMSGESRQ